MASLAMNSTHSLSSHPYVGAVKLKHKSVNKFKTLLCAAVGTASDRHGLEGCTVCGRSGNMLKKDRVVPNVSALN